VRMREPRFLQFPRLRPTGSSFARCYRILQKTHASHHSEQLTLLAVQVEYKCGQVNT
jgi:hypothetical protein